MIALVGESGAGKSTSSAHLADLGFHLVAIAANLREAAKSLYGVPTREQVQQLARDEQAEHGNDIIAVRALAEIDNGEFGDIVLDGLRNSEELAFARAFAANAGYEFGMIALRVPSEIRFGRVVGRKRGGDPISRAKFDEADKHALGNGTEGFQQNGYLMDVADYTIENVGDLDALKAKIENVVSKERRKMTSASRSLADDTEIALEIARKAAAMALDFFNRRHELATDAKKSPVDLVSEADGALEVYLRQALADAFPSDGFLGEESGGDTSGSLWIVDPIDGTMNFLKGLPMWGVSMGLVIDGAPKIGIIIFPALGDEYVAIEGQGSTCNGKPIRVSGNRDIERALVIFGRSPDLPPDGPLKFATETMQKNALLYAFGCCVYNMTCVASGACDCYVEQRVYPWDGAASSLLVREAGGHANFELSEDAIKNGYSIAAANNAEWLPT